MQNIYRIIDANLNRAREGLRIIEDCARFALNAPVISSQAKSLRSRLAAVADAIGDDQLIRSRDNQGDTGTKITCPSEMTRRDLKQIVSAGCKRLEESLRTIEEYSKLVTPDQAAIAERMRYDSYILEQNILGKLSVTTRLQEAKIYALISSDMYLGDLCKLAEEIISAGVDVIQLREKSSTTDADFLRLARTLKDITNKSGALLVINDRADIASIVQADGLHLGQDDLPTHEVRRLLQPGTFIGRSCHSMEHVENELANGADYIALGPMFTTATKDKKPVGPILLEQFVEKFGSDINNRPPVVVIGGINASNADELSKKGASCIAVCGEIIHAKNPQLATKNLRDAFCKNTKR